MFKKSLSGSWSTKLVMHNERDALEALVSEHEQRLAAAGHADFPFHICTPYVGLSVPGKKIVLVGLNPTGALGRYLLDAYCPINGLREGAYEQYVTREAGSKPSKARPRFTRCFDEVARTLGSRWD